MANWRMFSYYLLAEFIPDINPLNEFKLRNKLDCYYHKSADSEELPETVTDVKRKIKEFVVGGHGWAPCH